MRQTLKLFHRRTNPFSIAYKKQFKASKMGGGLVAGASKKESPLELKSKSHGQGQGLGQEYKKGESNNMESKEKIDQAAIAVVKAMRAENMNQAKSITDFQKISYGLNIYENEFLETLTDCARMLTNLNRDKELLKGFAEPYIPPKASEPICITYTDHYVYDFSKPPPPPSVKFGVQVSKLPFKSKAEKHNFLLLAGEKYDPYDDSVILEAKGEATSDPTKDCVKELQVCYSQLQAMLKHARENDFTSIKLDLTHVPARRSKLIFPSSWIQAAN